MHLHTEATTGRFRSVDRRADTTDRRRQARQLTEALAQDMLWHDHAPRVDLRDGTVLADEAVLRWRAGRRPAPVAAALVGGLDPRLAQALAAWQLQTGCAAALTRVDGRLMSLLLPPGLMPDGVLLDLVDRALADSGLPPHRLELRLSELVLMRPSTATLLCLSMLRDRGVELAVDDFGMHVGSVAVLRQIPLTALRLDPSLTYDLEPGSEDSALCAALAGLTRGLGIRLVAQALPQHADGERLHRTALCQLGIGAAVLRA